MTRQPFVLVALLALGGQHAAAQNQAAGQPPAAQTAKPAEPPAAAAALPSEPAPNEWPMWGGRPDRNMVSSMKGLPTTFDLKTKKNVKWVAELGSQAYGNTIVSGGVVLVGTNNEAGRDPNIKGDKGILMAFRESDGEFLWQAVHDKLAAGRANDWPFQGVCSSPLVDNGIVYYVSNRGEVVAVDIDGFRDGKNDGPVTDEKLTREVDADIIWRYDMMEELGVMQHNMANSSPVAYGNLIFVSTSNGQDESHVNVPSPKAPSIIALDKTTGKLVWEDNPVGEKILHGQWSSVAVGKIGDVVQAVVGQGDGYVRGYEATTGKRLWEFDLNPKDSVWPKTRNEVISTPIIQDNVVYVANGQDPEHGEGIGHLYAIDATKRGDITKTGQIWHYGDIRRSISTGALYNGILFYSDFSGFLHAVDAKTGKPYWKHDMFAAIWGSPMVIDGKVYLGDEDGDVAVLAADKTMKLIAESNMGSSVYSTPVPANGTLFIVNRNQLVALAEGAGGSAPVK
jgi:outer membrane protein assembly factor BamB